MLRALIQNKRKNFFLHVHGECASPPADVWGESRFLKKWQSDKDSFTARHKQKESVQKKKTETQDVISVIMLD